MCIIQDSAVVLQDVLGEVAQQAARPSGFCVRRSKLRGEAWVQGLVFGWLAQPQATLCQLAQAAACAGAPVSPQAMERRFTAQGAALLEQVLAAAVQRGLATNSRDRSRDRNHDRSRDRSRDPLWGFERVLIQDSTVVALPAALAEQWPGGSGAAALKVQVRWEFTSGSLQAPLLVPGRWHDMRAAQQHEAPQAGELHVADLGYFALSRLQHIMQEQAFFLSRYKVGTHIQLPPHAGAVTAAAAAAVTAAASESLAQWLSQVPKEQQVVDCPVVVGARERLACRLVAVRVPAQVALQRRARLRQDARRKGQSLSVQRLALAGWTLLLTNAPAARLSVAQAVALYRTRWQIERLFRLWKESLQLTTWRSRKPWRVLCEVYAKFLACLLTQRLIVAGVWHQPQRSLHKAAQVVAQHALHLLCHLACRRALSRALTHLLQAMTVACQMERRRAKPATFQLLQQPALALS